MRKYRALSVLLAAVVVTACASEVKRQSVELTVSMPEFGQRYELRKDVSFLLDSGYSRTIPAGTEFAAAGRLPQGLVLRTTQTVLTVEGAHVHEAYAVLGGDQLVGFYLPVEKAYSALPVATPFPLVERKQ